MAVRSAASVSENRSSSSSPTRRTSADDIIVIDKGRVIAHGTPTHLKDAAGRAAVVVTVTSVTDLGAAEAVVRRFTDEVHVDRPARRLTARAGGLPDMLAIGEAVAESGIAIDDLGLARPSLDDVFLHLTGHRAEESADDARDGAALEEAAQ